MTTNNADCNSFTAITNAWYNQLCKSLNLSVDHFQLVQPVAICASDEALWACKNQVAPNTLKYNYWYYDQPAFFSEYAAIVKQLQFPDSSFEKDIGKTVYAKWNDYLKGLPQPPPESALPGIWFQWAMLNAPSVANIGRTDLGCQVLIKGAQAALAPYLGSNAQLPEFSPSFTNLITTLQASPSTSFSFDSGTANPDVSNSWVPGNDPVFFGIYTGSWCGYLLNKKFAQSAIAVSTQIDHFAVVPVTPGAWYNSGLLHLALASQSVPPWEAGASWNTYFGAGGTLHYAIGAVVVLDGISLTLTSNAFFTSEEQSIIKSQAMPGYWPMYGPQLSGISTNDISFDSGTMTINFRVTAGNPVIIGNNVFAIGQYLGGV